MSVPCCNSRVAFSVHKMLYNCRSANELVSPNVRNKTLFSLCKEPWMNQHIHWWYQQLEWRMVITLLVWGFCCHLGCIVAPLRLFVCFVCHVEIPQTTAPPAGKPLPRGHLNTTSLRKWIPEGKTHFGNDHLIRICYCQPSKWVTEWFLYLRNISPAK